MSPSSQLFQRVQRNAQDDGKAAYFRLHRHRYAAILAALAAPPAHVLEVGVTPGQCTQLLVEAGYRVSGVDLDPSARQALWERLGVEVRRANLEREPVPFADNTFDQVVFSEVIEHLVFSPLPLLRELRRVLVPGGRLVLTTPNELYAKSRLLALGRMLLWRSLSSPAEFRHQMQLEGEARYTTHSRTYTMDELCWVVEQAGLSIAQRHYSAAWERVGLEAGRVWRHPLRVLAKGAFAALTGAIPPTRSMLLVVAEKR
jgi:SAM-dependent methyltransferase